MHGVLLAEGAVLCELHSVRIVLLVLDGVVVALFALLASQCHFHSHLRSPPFSKWPGGRNPTRIHINFS